MSIVTVSELDTPALCLDAGALERNISRMAAFLRDKPTRLRPHSKTHKCPTIAWLQMRAGAIGITCAKVGEAEVMARAGIPDILIANEVIGGAKIARLMHLAAMTNMMVAVDDLDNARDLSQAAVARDVSLRFLVEVDVGMGRCGVTPGEAALDLARRASALPGLRFCGLMGYEGHAVMIPDLEARRQATYRSLEQLMATRDLLVANGLAVDIVSGGGSGTYAITGAYEGVTEIQAGSYATMDAKYRSVGLDFEQALFVLARVISTHGDLAIIDAGMKTVTYEFGLPEVAQPSGWRVAHLSEEHGTLRREEGEPLRRGDTVIIIPSHGCTTINLHDAYHVIREGRFEGLWPIAARGAVR